MASNVVQVPIASGLMAHVETSHGWEEGEGTVAGECCAELEIGFDLHAPVARSSFPAEVSADWSSGDEGCLVVGGARGEVRWLPETQRLVVRVDVHPNAVTQSLAGVLNFATAVALAARGGVLVHASGNVLDEQAVLFLGVSGAGKTTTARRLGREGFGRISDDIVVVRTAAAGSPALVSVEPFLGDRAARLRGRAGRCWPLKIAFAIEKGGERTHIVERVARPLASWASSLFVPALPSRLAPQLLDTLGTFAASIPVLRLAVAPRGAIASHILHL